MKTKEEIESFLRDEAPLFHREYKTNPKVFKRKHPGFYKLLLREAEQLKKVVLSSRRKFKKKKDVRKRKGGS